MSDEAKRPTILVIIGITGDLSRRYLLPAVESLGKSGELPEKFRIIGVSRKDISPKEVVASGKFSYISDRTEMFQMNLEDEADYTRLRKHLASVEHTFKNKAQVLFYLAIPPQASDVVINLLGEAGFGKDEQTKLLLEKPFGTDYPSASELVDRTKKYFDEDQVYRIDHYLAKEMAQNLLIFRSSNSLFKRTWGEDFIEQIEILVAEKIGIEGRAAFY